jgi:serine/threonine-protein kinase 24/25/MST4
MILTMSPPELDSSKFSVYMRDFVKVCLTKDVKERPSADQLLKHPFLSSMDHKQCKQSYLEIMKKYLDSNQVDSIFTYSSSKSNH